MKNVKGEEIFSSKEEKEKFYNREYDNDTYITEDIFFKGFMTGKDDHFTQIVLPFAVKNEVKSVLDVGADYGRYSAKFYDAGIHDITAMELTPLRHIRLKSVLARYGYTEIKTVLQDIEDGLNENYDLIFMSDLVEHLDDWRKVWKDCLEHSKFVYALIPKEDSWNWSPDHTVRFTDNMATELTDMSAENIYSVQLEYDSQNVWYAVLVRGYL